MTTLSKWTQKPPIWTPNATMVDPAWRWAWDGLIMAMPFWDVGSAPAPRDVMQRTRATRTGTPTLEVHPQAGRGLFFDSTDEITYVLPKTIGTSGEVGDGFTALMVCRVTSDLTLRQRVMRLFNDADGSIFFLEYRGNVGGDPYQFGFQDTGGGFPNMTSDNAYVASRFDVLVLVWTDQTSMQLFRDGIEEPSTEDVADITSATKIADQIRLGANATGSLVSNSALFEFLLWDHVLTDAQIFKISQGFYGPLHQRNRSIVLPVVAAAADFPVGPLITSIPLTSKVGGTLVG